MLSPEDAQRIVPEALKTGYSLVRQPVSAKGPQGRGSRESGVPGEEIILSARLWPGEYENGKAGDRTPERPGADCVDVCGIKGLDQESPINTGLERSGPFSLTRKTG
jgi:hypothetical protein